MSCIPTSADAHTPQQVYEAIAEVQRSVSGPFAHVTAAALLDVLRHAFPTVASFTVETRDFDNGDFPALARVTLLDGTKLDSSDDSLLDIEDELAGYFADLADHLDDDEYQAATFLELFNEPSVDRKPMSELAADLVSAGGCVPPVVLVIRDPDYANAIQTWPGIGMPVVIDVDLGSQFDRRPGSVRQWQDWRDGLIESYAATGLPQQHPALAALDSALDAAHPDS